MLTVTPSLTSSVVHRSACENLLASDISPAAVRALAQCNGQQAKEEGDAAGLHFGS